MSEMFPRPKASEDKFERADPENLFEAVFLTLWSYEKQGKKPGAECWQADTRWKRPALIGDIRDAWLTIVGGDYLFPWHDDFVVDCFVALRKCTNPVKAELCKYFNREVPGRWAQTEAV